MSNQWDAQTYHAEAEASVDAERQAAIDSHERAAARERDAEPNGRDRGPAPDPWGDPEPERGA